MATRPDLSPDTIAPRVSPGVAPPDGPVEDPMDEPFPTSSIRIIQITVCRKRPRPLTETRRLRVTRNILDGHASIGGLA
jgi:hypothetical protein